MIGRVELARYRALEALLPDPKLADPDPKRAAHIPPDQESFLKAYESREAEMINFLKEHNLVTLAGLSRAVSNSAVAGSVQADQSRRLHESSRRLRQRSDRVLFHSDLQSGVEELLYSRGDRRSAADSRTRRNSRTFPAALDRESFERRNPPSARGRACSSKAGRFTAKKC